MRWISCVSLILMMLADVCLACLLSYKMSNVLDFGYAGFFCYLSLRPHVLEDSARSMTSLGDAAVVCLSIYL